MGAPENVCKTLNTRAWFFIRIALENECSFIYPRRDGFPDNQWGGFRISNLRLETTRLVCPCQISTYLSSTSSNAKVMHFSLIEEGGFGELKIPSPLKLLLGTFLPKKTSWQANCSFVHPMIVYGAYTGPCRRDRDITQDEAPPMPSRSSQFTQTQRQ